MNTELDLLRSEVKRLRQELDEANNVLQAISHGEVDALLVSDEAGDQVYVLRGADHVYRALVEQMQDGCVTIGVNGTILFCNKNFADILRVPLEKVVGSSLHEYLTPEDWKSLASFMLQSQGGFREECFLRVGGSCIPVSISASIIDLNGDKFICLVVTDLTELRRNERFLQMVFGQAKDPIIACDVQGRIVKTNAAAEALFKQPFAREFFDEALEFYRVADGTRLSLNDALDSHTHYGEEVYCFTCEGERLNLMVNANRFSLNDGDGLAGCVVMLSDITEKARLATEMNRLDRLNLVGEVAAGIGHEVRNPLTTVRGYLQLFTYKPAYAEDYARLKLMMEELDRANSIITEFLSLAKDKVVELVPGVINDTVQTIFPLLQADAFRLGHEIKLELGIIPHVAYDDQALRQLIINLVRNGLEAMEVRGVVTISSYVQAEKVVLAVTDTGPGIPNEIRHSLGTPFLTTKESGTGLGLAVCFRIAANHGAIIDFVSSEKGTTFFVRFSPVSE